MHSKKQRLLASLSPQMSPQIDELTTQQAADYLNVSHPYLLNLVSKGELASRTVDGEQRIDRDVIVQYKTESDKRRRAALEELVRISQELELD